jgi:hypothetical protein
MLSQIKCPRGAECKPLANVVPNDVSTFVCVGLHGEDVDPPQDRFRHCFKSDTTDSMYDYDLYDLKSCISVMSDAVLLDELDSNRDGFIIEEV